MTVPAPIQTVEFFPELEGPLEKLRQLEELFKHDPHLVFRDGEYVLLRGNCLDTCDNAPSVIKRMEQVLPRIAGSAAIMSGSDFSQVKCVKVHECDSRDGKLFTRKIIAFMSGHATMRLHGANAPETPGPSVAAEWAERATTDPEVQTMLTFVALPPTWMNLYKILEIAMLKHSAIIAPSGSPLRTKVELLKRTANSVQVLGTESRHAVSPRPPPEEAMSRENARKVVFEVVRKRLSLCDNSRTE
jgi:hypothetical protein